MRVEKLEKLEKLSNRRNSEEREYFLNWVQFSEKEFLKCSQNAFTQGEAAKCQTENSSKSI